MTNMKRLKNKIFCFSPEVMLATFLFEFFAGTVAIFRYKSSKIKTLIVALLFALAGFQAAEFMVCGGWGWSGVEWAKFGYLSITLLPPLGLHLIHEISGRKIGLLQKVSYATMVAFSIYFVFSKSGVFADENTCRANYSVFNTPNGLASLLYGLYYYGWLIVALVVGFRNIKFMEPELSKKIFNKKLLLNKISAMKWLMGGYLAFMLPTTIVNIIDPTTIEGIPSIMCGFAVLMAATLILFVAPKTLEK